LNVAEREREVVVEVKEGCGFVADLIKIKRDRLTWR